MIRINERAPDFMAQSTHGPLQLSSYKGRWVVLFSHPADFTPVCTSEFIGFAKRAADFAAINCSLVGLSVDSVYSHIAWVRDIERKFQVQIPFPVIEDVTMQISAMYGMIQPAESHTSTVRAVFIIDDQGILRAMIYYPMASGRSVAEILRLVRSIQISDAQDVGTPEGWQPGDPVILAAPKTQHDAQERLENAAERGIDCTDWYFCRKNPPARQKKTA